MKCKEGKQPHGKLIGSKRTSQIDKFGAHHQPARLNTTVEFKNILTIVLTLFQR